MTTNGDFGGFRALIDEAKQIAADEKARPLVECPVCGEPLDQNSRGEKACEMGHFRAPAGALRSQYA